MEKRGGRWRGSGKGNGKGKGKGRGKGGGGGGGMEEGEVEEWTPRRDSRPSNYGEKGVDKKSICQA